MSLTPWTDRTTGGPNKVFYNLCKGLDRIGVPYSINKSPSRHTLNLVHSSVDGLIEVSLNRIPALVGPNLVVLPRDLPPYLKIGHTIFLHPAQWCKDSWLFLGYDRNPIEIWPVGIDWEDFQVRRDASVNKVLIYFKRRDPKLLQKAVDIVASFHMQPVVIEYGKYSEQDYKEALASCRFGIWIGTSESQGIAQQEALASGLPLIILDVSSFWDEYPYPSYPFPHKFSDFKPSSAPYFSDQCGLIIESVAELPNALEFLLGHFDDYNPLDYIRTNHTLENAAARLLEIFSLLPPGNRQIQADRQIKLRKLLLKNSFRTRRILSKVRMQLNK